MTTFQLEATASVLSQPEATTDDRRLLDALRRGDEAVFVSLLERYHLSMVRLALSYVRDHAAAEEVTQEAWVGVLQGLPQFEERSSLKTWIFRILINCAQMRGRRERRSVPFSMLWGGDANSPEPAVEPERFRTSGPWIGYWASYPHSWDDIPEERLLSQEVRAYIDAAIAQLPPNQRTVIALRDIEGLSSGEVCRILEISEANQRVLLHRARSRVRRALEQYLDEI